MSSYAIKTDGTLWAWGYNNAGQLGQGNLTSYLSPKQIGVLTNWSTISATGQSLLSIKTNGTLWSWGNNAQGQLGLNNLSSYSSPIQVGLLNTWTNIWSGSNFSLGILLI